MKKAFYSIVASTMLITALSCATKKSPIINAASTTPVEGVMTDYLELVQQPYKIEFEKKGDRGKGWEDYQAFINLKFKIKKPFDQQIPNGYNQGVGVDVKLYDESGGQPVSETFGLAGNEQGEFEEFLKSGSGERVFKMRGSGCDGSSEFFDKADWDKVKFLRVVTRINN